MIKIDFLKYHKHHIPSLIYMWYDVLGHITEPDITYKEVLEVFLDSAKNADALPLIIVALDRDKPVGMCSLTEENWLQERGPWLFKLCVDHKYKGQGIGKLIIEYAKQVMKELGFEELHLYAVNEKLTLWYQSIGWQKLHKIYGERFDMDLMKIELCE